MFYPLQETCTTSKYTLLKVVSCLLGVLQSNGGKNVFYDHVGFLEEVATPPYWPPSAVQFLWYIHPLLACVDKAAAGVTLMSMSCSVLSVLRRQFLPPSQRSVAAALWVSLTHLRWRGWERPRWRLQWGVCSSAEGWADHRWEVSDAPPAPPLASLPTLLPSSAQSSGKVSLKFHWFIFIYFFLPSAVSLERGATSGDLWPLQRGTAHTLPLIPSAGMWSEKCQRVAGLFIAQMGGTEATAYVAVSLSAVLTVATGYSLLSLKSEWNQTHRNVDTVKWAVFKVCRAYTGQNIIELRILASTIDTHSHIQMSTQHYCC